MKAGGACLFERAHHQRIHSVLLSLDANLLAQFKCYFGGGTAVALRFGEFRESVDIDFVVADVPSYRELRQRLTSAAGINALTRRDTPLQQARELRADQYGIRTLLRLAEADIKFEIVLEARIALQTPSPTDVIGGVTCLCVPDLIACKLLANSDRWADDSVFSRDLIDLAMMRASGVPLRQARAKAMLAYGSSIDADALKAVDHLLGRPGRLERCMAALRISAPKALLWQRLLSLQRALQKASPA